MTEKEKFISDVAKIVQKYAPKYSIAVHSPIIAQAILESGWGKTKLASVYHNYFGLKCGSKWTGKSVNLKTTEEYTYGVTTVIKDNFRVYDSLEDGIKGYFEFIQLERYHNLRGITDPEKYLKTILADGYATEHDYVTQNMALIKQYNLTQYDKEVQMSATTKSTDVQKVIDVAMAEVGYIEKKSNANLDSKTANKGSNNYTKYWRDMKPSWQGEPYCDCFVDWCFMKAYGREKAQELLCGGFGEYYTPSSAQYFINKNQWSSRPAIGAQIFFKNSSRICHTGIVYKFDSKRVYTIEGNTSNGEFNAEGGAVCKKSYELNNSRIAGYGIVNYGKSTTTTTTTTGKSYTGSYPTLPSRGYFKNGDVSAEVCKVKKFLNWAIGSKLTETNKNYFDKTVAEVKKFQKKVGITDDGEWGKNTQAKAKTFKK